MIERVVRVSAELELPPFQTKIETLGEREVGIEAARPYYHATTRVTVSAAGRSGEGRGVEPFVHGPVGQMATLHAIGARPYLRSDVCQGGLGRDVQEIARRGVENAAQLPAAQSAIEH